MFQRPDSSWLQLFATLKAGTEIQEAVPLVNAAATAFFRTHATDDEATIAVVPAGGGGPKAVEFAIVMVAVMLVLVIACANVSNLVMSRVISRRKEFAVRISLGARRFDLICHCLAVSLVLALLSGAVGLLVGYWIIETFLAATGIFHEALDLRPDIRATLFQRYFDRKIELLYRLLR
ncbi:MAG: FtsX-like permease family protein [Acidobacteria bacterium]|nr:MAG: FtsX-like permease family protein [Acidobacteriota bacterium]